MPSQRWVVNDLMLCDCVFTIPVSLSNHSLNLSHSVLLMAYKWQEYFKYFTFKDSQDDDLSDKKNFDLFMKYLRNELDKIDSFVKNKKNINIDQIMKLTNLAENYNVSELIDSYLAANFKKTINILNENNFSIEDCMLITRTLLVKSKRLYKLLLEINNNKSIEEAISSFNPPIFWKDKEIVKQQIKNWSLNRAENLIYKTNELELLIKKNSYNSINILSDFIINQPNRINN